MAVVHVPPSEATEVARKLLAAAQMLGFPASVVATSSDGVFGFSFVVPDEVEQAAMRGWGADRQPEPDPEPAPKRKGGRPRKTVASEPEERQ